MKKLLTPILFTMLTGALFNLSADQIDDSMFFKSEVKDAKTCELIVQNGEISFPKSVTNPAISCPDAFAWKKFLETIQSEFWTNWSYDTYTWPEKPYPLCTEDAVDKSACCDPDSTTNPGYDNKSNPGIHCPYIPENQLALNTNMKKSFNVDSKKVSSHGTIMDKIDPGRVIRQEMAEIVYRNKPMVDYVFRNNLYNNEGLGTRFKMTVTSNANNAPYQAKNLNISFPVDSIMFKTDWIHEDDAKALGMNQNKKNPYITRYIKSNIGDNDPGVFKKGLYYLVSITAASKDLPNWHWYAIEHVDNKGRCDYTGCNDSYGYMNMNKNIPDGFAKNFIKPHTTSDNLKQASSIFVTGKRYDSGKINPSLAKVFKALGIGQKDDNDSHSISVGDNAWMSYRLKGTQTEFTTNHGINTVLGNSVTEGGFVNTSSCMTCHIQATVDSEGHPAISSIGFSSNLNLFGYNQSSKGTPSQSWFYRPGTTEPIAVTTDFVWGILFSKPLDK